MRTVAIVQARLGSSRLPLKSLLCLRNKPIIDWVTERLAKSNRLDDIIVAVPDTPLDKVLARHLENAGCNFIRGPENDVLSRFVMAAEAAKADVVVRICADNPLVSWEAIDKLVDFYADGKCDYAWNHIPRNNKWPDGLGGEIISIELLREIAKKAILPAQREHCLNYIWDNADKFKLATFDPKEAWLKHPELKLDIDTVDDFAKLSLLPIEPGQDLLSLMKVLVSIN